MTILYNGKEISLEDLKAATKKRNDHYKTLSPSEKVTFNKNWSEFEAQNTLEELTNKEK